MTTIKSFIIIFFLIILSYSLSAQKVLINEILASNSFVITDETGDYTDWIEIANTSDNEEINLAGFFLTDNYKDLCKWQIPNSTPAQTTIKPHGFIIIWADGEPEKGVLHANFKLALEGEQLALVQVLGNDTIILDSLTFNAQVENISYARVLDNINKWGFFDKPTPGAENSGAYLPNAILTPEASVKSGFFYNPVNVQLTSPISDAEMRYTTDGSDPSSNSLLYSSTLTFDSTTVLRAKVITNSKVECPIVTFSYFINEDFQKIEQSKRLPVISLTTDPKNLFDPEIGIYVKGNSNAFGGTCGTPGNYWEDWERPVNIELIEPNGISGINQDAGIKIFGNCSRLFAQRPFSVFARDEYGKNSFDYKFFNDRENTKFKSIIIRNAGNDWHRALFRDALAQELVHGQMKIDYVSSRQSIVYINGKFWGIYNIREKVNEDYIAKNNFKIDADKVDILEKLGNVIEGDSVDYINFRNFLQNNNLSNNSLYEYVGKQMDIDNYINYQIAQIFYANIDMPSNTKLWREQHPSGKWRWLLFDTDLGLANSAHEGYGVNFNMVNFATTNNISSGWPYLHPESTMIMVKLLENNHFKNHFLQSFCAHLNTTFKDTRILSKIDSMQNAIAEYIPMQIEKWGGVDIDFSPYGKYFTTTAEWINSVDVLKDFAQRRASFVRQHLMDRFNIKDTVLLTLKTNQYIMGQIVVNEVIIPDSLQSGYYFQEIPLKLTAKAHKGFAFSKWEGVDDNLAFNPVIEILPSETATITAVFKKIPNVKISEVHYNSPKDKNFDFIEIVNPNNESIDISGYYFSNGLDFKFPAGTIIKPFEYIIIVKVLDNFNDINCQKFQWTGTGGLSNFGEYISLSDKSGKIISQVPFDNNNPWPSETNGNSSLAIDDLRLDDEIFENWKLSDQPEGTPGKHFIQAISNNLIINEIMPSNDTVMFDNFKEADDWIELYNKSNSSVSLNGWYVSDDRKNLTKYQFPIISSEDLIIKPGNYLILWADNDLQQGDLHLNFKLKHQGDTIFLSNDGISVSDSIVYQEVTQNASFGRYPNANNEFIKFDIATPGVHNSLPPTFESNPILTGTLLEPYNYQLIAKDPDNDQLIYGFIKTPRWLKLQSENNQNSLAGTPTQSFSGINKVKIYVTDGYTPLVIQEFDIQVNKKPETGIINEKNEGNSIDVYPNPFSESIQIRNTKSNNIKYIRILNNLGKVVKEIELKTSQSEIKVEVSNLPASVYYVQVVSNQGITTNKVVKVKQ